MDDATPVPTPFSQLLERRSRNDRTVNYRVTEDWMQGRTTFGGLIASLALQSMRDVAGSDWPVRALQTSFIGPVGGATSVDVLLLRQGRNVRQVQATVHSHGVVAAVVLGTFGVARPTLVPVHRPPQPAVATSLNDAIEIPYIPGFTPVFLQHLRSRWAEGEFPMAGKPSWHSRIFTRLREERIDPELQAVMLADMPPTPVLSTFDKRVAASSVSWELELPFRAPQPTAPDTTDGWYRVDTDVTAASDGFVSQRSLLWSPAGELAAIGYQLVGVYG